MDKKELKLYLKMTPKELEEYLKFKRRGSRINNKYDRNKRKKKDKDYIKED